MDYAKILEFYKGKRVFLTGHTGFKGAWLSLILQKAGAPVTGYSLEPPTDPALFELANVAAGEGMTSVIGDVRDFDHMKKAFEASKPEIVIHMAAQPLVIESYRSPAYTYETNVMGTVNLLECVRTSSGVRSVLNVTTDKVYSNDESGRPFVEDMPLDGYDPYSNSKSCSELVSATYRRSFLQEAGVALSTARAGNVIGGGDMADNRIIPDCVRAALAGEDIVIRNPHAVRPFQHVLEPVFAYLMIAAAQYDDPSLAGSYNVGPDEKDCVNAGRMADIFCEKWGEGMKWINKSTGGFHEAGFLRLECTHLKETFGWDCVWDIGKAVEKTVQWSKAVRDKEDARRVCLKQIDEFIADGKLTGTH